MSFADSWHWASCALLLLTLHFFMFSFYPPLSFSLSLAFSFSLSLFLSLSLYLCPPLSLCGCKTHVIWCPLPNILFLIISIHSSYKILQLFTDYLLRLPSSELLEKHLFRSRANRRLVWFHPVGDESCGFRLRGIFWVFLRLIFNFCQEWSPNSCHQRLATNFH